MRVSLTVVQKTTSRDIKTCAAKDQPAFQRLPETQFGQLLREGVEYAATCTTLLPPRARLETASVGNNPSTVVSVGAL